MTRKWQPKIKVACGSCGWRGKRTRRMLTKNCPKCNHYYPKPFNYESKKKC